MIQNPSDIYRVYIIKTKAAFLARIFLRDCVEKFLLTKE